MVTPEGDIDMLSAHRLRAALCRTWEDSRCRRVAVDLSRVSLLDASGLRVLVEWGERMERRGGRPMLIGPSAAARRVLEASETLAAFQILPSREALREG